MPAKRLPQGSNGFRLFHEDRDPILNNALKGIERTLRESMATNSPYTMRRTWFDRVMDPRRNINDECGYPSTGQLSPESFQDLYEREPIAARVVEFMPKESWQVVPEVYEIERGQIQTAFEDAWDGLSENLRAEGGVSYAAEEQSSAIWETLLRADVLSGIGQYGVILLGLDDVTDAYQLRQPVQGISEVGSTWYENEGDGANGKPKFRPMGVTANGKVDYVKPGTAPVYNLVVDPASTGRRRLLYTRVFPESMARINRWESNPSSPRYGKPVTYQITFHDPNAGYTGQGAPMMTRDVHWTRIIHVADTHHMACSNESLAIPRMRPVLNPLLDIQKVRGASAEGYWKACFTYLFFVTHPQLGGDVEIDHEAMKDFYEELINGLQRGGTLEGMSPQAVAPTVNDPTPHLNCHIEAICIKNGWPIRIFKGSERGELSSEQDVGEHKNRVKQREWGYNSPGLVSPLSSRLIMVGVLPAPDLKRAEASLNSVKRDPKLVTMRVRGGHLVYNKETFRDAATSVPVLHLARSGFKTFWPDISTQSDKQKADVLLIRTQALTTFLQGGEAGMTMYDWYTRWAGMSHEEATVVVAAASGIEQETEVIVEEPEPEGVIEPAEPEPQGEQGVEEEVPAPAPPAL